MNLKLKKAYITEKPILANLLELYAYDFTEHCDFDIGDDGFYGYKDLSLYWTDSDKFPYLIYCDGKIAGFVLVQKRSSVSENNEVWDIAEFFIMKKYKRKGLGTKVASKIWSKFPGQWQVRVLVENKIASAFWLKAIRNFISTEPKSCDLMLKGESWRVYCFKSEDIIVSKYISKDYSYNL